ncbi:MAG: CCA tRNA nucleotidyltransferase [Sulfolobales archaeon]|nr:CCA tRNA nucleotidyltransferase [Sulfolobales archaeon]MDW8083407.1 CCA tRNA nucleotidyltransferase [Sulfolobales archaeon]
MGDIERVLEESLHELRPREDERAEAIEIYGEIKKVIETSLRIPYEFTVELHGSVAKGTELRGMIDLDVFLLIRYDDISREWLEKEVVKPLLNVFKKLYECVRLRYSTHPYVYLQLGKYEVDVVPAYWARSTSEIKTAVDRTPFHTRYVVSKLSEEMKDEVRLLKAFFKNVGVYGAEIKFEGFSGYLTELLVIKYGSFINALKNISKWRFSEIVVVEEPVEVSYNYLRKVFKAPLIIPDPVDLKRNAASAVSAESLARAVLASSIFLQKPSKNMLLAGVESLGESDVESLRRLAIETGREVVGVVFKLFNEVAPDVLWGKLRSTTKSLLNLLEREGFKVVSYSIWSDEISEAAVIVTIMPRELSLYEIHLGPPLGRVNDIGSFTLKYYSTSRGLGPYVTPSGRIFTLRQRKYVHPHQVVEDYAKSLKPEGELYVSAILKNLDEVCEYVRIRRSPELSTVFRRAIKLEIF